MRNIQMKTPGLGRVDRKVKLAWKTDIGNSLLYWN